VDKDDVLAEFKRRLHAEWLPRYCAARGYDPAGLVEKSLNVTPEDARDFMQALDKKLVTEVSPGSYKAPLGSAHEVIFWEGLKSVTPRRISLWKEPVITLAALYRLHKEWGWRAERLGNQSKRPWAFDFLGYGPGNNPEVLLAGEVKKSANEVRLLLKYLQDSDVLCATGELSAAKNNARRKWLGLLEHRPALLWVVGPYPTSHLFRVEYVEAEATVGGITLTECRREQGISIRTQADRAHRFSDAEFEILLSQCASCRHYRPSDVACAAFPDGIPYEIATNQVSHRQPYEGDGGVRYEAH
jgi:hypothetical protein